MVQNAGSYQTTFPRSIVSLRPLQLVEATREVESRSRRMKEISSRGSPFGLARRANYGAHQHIWSGNERMIAAKQPQKPHPKPLQPLDLERGRSRFRRALNAPRYSQLKLAFPTSPPGPRQPLLG